MSSRVPFRFLWNSGEAPGREGWEVRRARLPPTVGLWAVPGGSGRGSPVRGRRLREPHLRTPSSSGRRKSAPSPRAASAPSPTTTRRTPAAGATGSSQGDQPGGHRQGPAHGTDLRGTLPAAPRRAGRRSKRNGPGIRPRARRRWSGAPAKARAARSSGSRRPVSRVRARKRLFPRREGDRHGGAPGRRCRGMRPGPGAGRGWFFLRNPEKA